jgi:hypothetical protein
MTQRRQEVTKTRQSRKAGLEQDAGVQTPAGDYSVNALSKLTGKDRRTLDKLLVGVSPTRTEGKTKFYRLVDVEAKLQEEPSKSLKDEKTIEEIRKLRMANDLAAKLLTVKAKVCESMRRCLSPMAITLEQRLVNEYPTAVAGLDVPQARIYGKRLCDELMVFLQAFEKEWTEPGTASS